MSETITATYENGVLKPSRPLQLPSPTQVRLTIEIVDTDIATNQRRQALTALEEIWQRTSIDSQGNRLTREQLHERR